MLTKNLYSLDEVQACLLHRHCESTFWCNELIVSGYIGEVISTLFQSWLWNNLSPQWLLYAWQHLVICESEMDILIAQFLKEEAIEKKFRDSVREAAERCAEAEEERDARLLEDAAEEKVR